VENFGPSDPTPKVGAWCNVNENVNLYSASSQKNNASNALDVPSTVERERTSVYNENIQFACPAHANSFGTSSMSLVKRQRKVRRPYVSS